jgi:hypothetical protein
MLRSSPVGIRSAATAAASAAFRSLAKSPRLPAARQRRLDRLLDKSQEATLSAKESAELETMLDSIDRKSFWMVARSLVEKRNAAVTRTAARKAKIGSK